MKMKLLKETIKELIKESATETQGVFWRVQPAGRNLFGHQSRLAFDKVAGIFAFADPRQLFDTYTWIHVRKNVNAYEMISFLGEVTDEPPDSEGVVVKPERVLTREPLVTWLDRVMET
jgi:hypothetical protein